MLAASSRDTVRSKGRTGKSSRQLRSAWTDAWASAANPGALPMPLQSWLSEPSLRRINALAERGNPGAQKLATYWVGQGVGLMDNVKSARDVVLEMAEDYLDAVERLSASIDDRRLFGGVVERLDEDEHGQHRRLPGFRVSHRAQG